MASGEPVAMLYRIDLITTQRMTIEAESDQEARAMMDEIVRGINAHHHHGEATVAVLRGPHGPIGEGVPPSAEELKAAGVPLSKRDLTEAEARKVADWLGVPPEVLPR